MIRAWRTKYPDPDNREFVSIQYVPDTKLTPPWIMSVEDARKIFGPPIDALSDKAREIKLTMEIVRFADE